MVKAAKGKTIRKRILIILLSFTLLFVGLYAVFGGNGLMEIMRRKQMKVELQEDLQKIKEQNLYLRARIWALKNNLFEIEKIAREKLFLVKSGDFVFLLDEK